MKKRRQEGRAVSGAESADKLAPVEPMNQPAPKIAEAIGIGMSSRGDSVLAGDTKREVDKARETMQRGGVPLDGPEALARVIAAREEAHHVPKKRLAEGREGHNTAMAVCHDEWLRLRDAERNREGRSHYTDWAIAGTIASRCKLPNGKAAKQRTVYSVIKQNR